MSKEQTPPEKDRIQRVYSPHPRSTSVSPDRIISYIDIRKFVHLCVHSVGAIPHIPALSPAVAGVCECVCLRYLEVFSNQCGDAAVIEQSESFTRRRVHGTSSWPPVAVIHLLHRSACLASPSLQLDSHAPH